MAGTLAGLIIRHLGGKVSWVNRSPDRLTLLAELGIDVGEGDGVPPDLVLVMESRTTLSAVERARRLFPSVIGIYGETRPGELSYKGVDLDAIRRNELSAPLGRESPSVFVGSYGADLSDFQLAMVSLQDDLLGSDVSRLLQVRLSTLEAASEHLNERAKGKREIRKAAVILRS
jgi:hypothetical protein